MDGRHDGGADRRVRSRCGIVCLDLSSTICQCRSLGNWLTYCRYCQYFFVHHRMGYAQTVRSLSFMTGEMRRRHCSPRIGGRRSQLRHGSLRSGLAISRRLRELRDKLRRHGQCYDSVGRPNVHLHFQSLPFHAPERDVVFASGGFC